MTLKKSVILRSNLILKALGHRIPLAGWRPIFTVNENELIEYATSCTRIGCAQEFLLSPLRSGTFELMRVAKHANYCIAEIQADKPVQPSFAYIFCSCVEEFFDKSLFYEHMKRTELLGNCICKKLESMI